MASARRPPRRTVIAEDDGDEVGPPVYYGPRPYVVGPPLYYGYGPYYGGYYGGWEWGYRGRWGRRW
jgi:hypothetical protein